MEYSLSNAAFFFLTWKSIMPQIQHIAVNSISGQESIPGLSAFRTVHISEGSKNEPEAVRRTANALLEIKQSWLRNSNNSSGNNYEWNELLHILKLYGFPLGYHQDGTSNKHLYDLAEFSIRGIYPLNFLTVICSKFFPVCLVAPNSNVFIFL